MARDTADSSEEATGVDRVGHPGHRPDRQTRQASLSASPVVQLADPRGEEIGATAHLQRLIDQAPSLTPERCRSLLRLLGLTGSDPGLPSNAA